MPKPVPDSGASFLLQVSSVDAIHDDDDVEDRPFLQRKCGWFHKRFGLKGGAPGGENKKEIFG